jgi:GNAT superfamily N-acetyltransferase
MTQERDSDREIRPASDADAASIRAVWAANGDDIPDGGVDILTPYLAHLMGTGRVQVATAGNRVVGFGAVVERVGVAHLADLFVLPDHFGQGIGKQLLVALFGDTPRRTTFASADPRALPLYVRSGMTPLWPNLYLEVDVSRLPAPASGIDCERCRPETVAELERHWLGDACIADHHFWASLPGASPFIIRSSRAPAAVAHARLRRTGRDRWITRLVLAPDVDPVPVLVAAFHHASEGDPIGSCLPGPSPALRFLLDTGARIINRDTFMASDSGLFDPTRRISDGGIL